MELSSDIINRRDKFSSRVGKCKDELASLSDSFDILNLSDLDLENEETWLCKAEFETDSNYKDWLYGEPQVTKFSRIVPDLKSSKFIDTRTFTRPKKKVTRPSIEQFEQLYNRNDTNEPSKLLSQQVVEEEFEITPETNLRPLHFDLSQPTTHNFDSFVINSAELDSFQNMSPPSLVNSLCSSTFANLMENSFIRNDPVLREIRDRDYTETALLQDTEAPMFQSITESCSSINSDTPENFLRKVSFNNSFRKSCSENNETVVLEKTLEESSHNVTKTPESDDNTQKDMLNSTYSINTTICNTTSTEDLNSTKVIRPIESLNGTYRRTPKLNGTFKKSDLKNNRLSLNLTYELSKEPLDKTTSWSVEKDLNKEDLNRSNRSKSNAIIMQSDSIEDMKKRYSTSDIQVTDLNRLSYCINENVNKSKNVSSNDLNRTRSSLGSADSLDRMSSISGSSKGSNKMLNLEDIEAIVEMQERSLNQAMSTPKPNMETKKLWANNYISPILGNTKDHLSDSELSSEEFRSARSGLSSKISLDNYIKNPPVTRPKQQQRSSFILPGARPAQNLPSSIRGSYSNLRTIPANIGGSHTTLHKVNNMPRPMPSNLKTMGAKLKGSYTSLRPISANLPVAPPVSTSRSHSNIAPSVGGPPKIPELPDSTFAKPQIARTSGLPRPTGIPRPASRIPAPRSSSIRPTYSRTSNY